jgi:hypothetical protein
VLTIAGITRVARERGWVGHMRDRSPLRKPPKGNSVVDVLLPYLLAAVFLGSIVYGVLKWLKVL